MSYDGARTYDGVCPDANTRQDAGVHSNIRTETHRNWLYD